MIYRFLVLGHLLGDFYFQSDEVVRRKKKEWNVLAKHCLIYCICVFACSVWFVPHADGAMYIIYLCAIFLLHALTDFCKGHFYPEGNSCLWFAADQAIHLLLLLGPAGRFAGNGTIELWGNIIDGNAYQSSAAVIICVLTCGKPASVLVKTVFQDIKNRGRELGALNLRAQETDTQDRAGAAIGILEREIIFVLGILNQFSAIGFVLAAKSLARFEQLKNQGFAERYLIGTLLSALIAIICAASCRLMS